MAIENKKPLVSKKVKEKVSWDVKEELEKIKKFAGSIDIPEQYRNKDIDQIISESKEQYYRKKYAKDLSDRH